MNSHHAWTRGRDTIDTDPDRLDLPMIVGFLQTSYWAAGRSEATMHRSFAHSLCFGLYREACQIGFCRVVTDYATFAYIADVFVVEGFRGEGLALWMMETVVAHPDLQGFRRWVLATRDAHALYAQVGFRPLPNPGRFMERLGEASGDLIRDDGDADGRMTTTV